MEIRKAGVSCPVPGSYPLGQFAATELPGKNDELTVVLRRQVLRITRPLGGAATSVGFG